VDNTKSLARLAELLVPGLALIFLGISCYFFVRHFSPDSTEVASLIFFLSNLGGLLRMGASVVQWSREQRDAFLRETPDDKRSFCANIRAAVNVPLEAETELFKKFAEQAERRPRHPAQFDCWAYEMSMPPSQPYKVRIYFAFHDGRFGIAMVFGLPGSWHKSYFLAGEYVQTGSLLTLVNVYGDFHAVGGRGARIIFDRPEGSTPVIHLMALRVGDLFKADLPDVLRKHLA
jgi:hypothetical protein